jgi:hypothetical protein
VVDHVAAWRGGMGGYTDTYTSETDNGFFKNDGTYTDRRNIIAHPTYLDSYYYNTLQKNDAYTYHVVTFTDYVFDSKRTALPCHRCHR